jgi:hypothetical protein
MNLKRQEILAILVLIMLLLNIGLTAYQYIEARQPFTQYCDWMQPGQTLRCHR